MKALVFLNSKPFYVSVNVSYK